ncbi:hypothetical protein FANTH_13276 [Fusarium anthophilum]|uniref:Zn(2)-C6 fungal-type domain-containing protein n=1 Tax=Fusarium anthophilum TaxID=48485 RepID=A0A8H5DQ57_9HYPO|nr:hypothetical protein FANTH_13276 [Fusarium anthophilum]
MPDIKLRVKTGCVTCRQRRVKCDEAKPSCRNCSRFGRSCSWPNTSDMADKRHRRRRETPPASPPADEGTSPSKSGETSHDLVPILNNRPDFRLDSEFITHAEDLLESYHKANPSSTNPSIILGVPTSLYRLILRIIDSFNVPQSNLPNHLKRLRVELQYWEQLLFDDENSENVQHGDSRFNGLMIIATSLLLDLITEALASIDDAIGLSPSAGDGDGKPWRWQLDLAMNILQCPEEHQKWSSCYLGAWPLLILGYGARTIEEITLVKDILTKMQQRIGYGEVRRIIQELDEITTYKVLGSRMYQEPLSLCSTD